MGTGTNIEWAHHTYNPWIGCTKISSACDHCYAAEWDKRYHGGEHWGAGVERKRTSIQTRNAPYKWARKARETGERPRVFCCSLADVFDNEVPAEWRDELWQVIRDTPELDWLLLTKRIGNVPQMLPEDWGEGWPHVWLGITVVTNAEAERDIPKLQLIPAAIRWVSMEPLLERVEIEPFLVTESADPTPDTPFPDPNVYPALDWVVAGGESGPGARPMHPYWVRSLRDQCNEWAVPFLFKQWGDWAPRAGSLTGGGTNFSAIDPQCRRWPDCIRLGEHGRNTRYSENCGEDAGEDVFMQRVGKKEAGRLLDGLPHDEVPR